MTWKKNNSSFSCEKTKLYILLQNLKKYLGKSTEGKVIDGWNQKQNIPEPWEQLVAQILDY